MNFSYSYLVLSLVLLGSCIAGFLFFPEEKEIAWAFSIGDVWPLAMVYVFDLDLFDYKGDVP